jgi:hypothetical protein
MHPGNGSLASLPSGPGAENDTALWFPVVGARFSRIMSSVTVSTGQLRHPLARPFFWVSLALLLINDHVLKPAHLLPGVVTGKVSDFAGLLVAPVLVVTLLRVRGRGEQLDLDLAAPRPERGRGMGRIQDREPWHSVTQGLS